MVKRPVWLFLCFFDLFLISCDGALQECSSDDKDVKSGYSVVSVVNWNVQTFFDGETVGTEYSQFLNSAQWSRDKYLVRLQRLCRAITSLNADVYVLEEIENEGILYDISNQLAGSSWDSKKLWSYGCYCKETGSSIGCGILSRYPLSNVKSHALDIRTQGESQPSMRPILQASISQKESSLTIFVCHWKSKSGGEEESEIWRDWQEFSLAGQLKEELAKNCNSSSSAFLVCGDMNRDIEEFYIQSEGAANVKLRGQEKVAVYSPWLLSDGSVATEKGSYYFDGNWERIDNFFFCGNGKLTGFNVKAEEPFVNEKSLPNLYKIYTGEGYSDHLPIMCSVRF